MTKSDPMYPDIWIAGGSHLCSEQAVFATIVIGCNVVDKSDSIPCSGMFQWRKALLTNVVLESGLRVVRVS